MEVNNGVIRISNLRLLNSVYHTYPYESSPYWTLQKNSKGKLVAVNVILPEVRMPIKRQKFLQYDHWVQVNKTLNDVCDKLKVSCNIRSCTHTIRKGTKRYF